ncbi:MAG: hypothetical protein EOO38_25320, partial [Cytophagaceae bacterium]
MNHAFIEKYPIIPRMPSVFGPTASPRQASFESPPYDQASSPYKRAAYAIFETDAEALKRLLPDGFQLNGDARLALEFT